MAEPPDPTCYVTCSCEHCEGHIEFNEPYVGVFITCPHCGTQTKLYVPPPPASSSEPQPPSSPPTASAPAPPPRPSQAAALETLCLSPQWTPATFHDFVGHEKITARLELAAAAAKQRHEPIAHLLLAGSQGSGRNTLAYIISASMGASLRTGINPATATEFDLLTVLCNLECGDILLINDVHLLENGPRDTLCEAMETFHLRVTLTLDGSPRPVELNIPMFTLIGTAPTRDSVSQKLLARFPLVEVIPPYTPQVLADLAVRFASALDTRLDPAAARQLAAASGGAPRDVLKLVRRVQGYALVKAPGAAITPELAAQALELFAPWEQLDQYREPQETGPVRLPIPAEVRREVWRRDQGKCARCSSRERLEFDYIVPVSRGGSNTARNIELLCEPCNRSKSATIE